jgi:hypothetical protein
MARITLNVAQETFESAENKTGFDPVPKGWYRCNVFEVKAKESGPNSKNPGSPQINVQFKIQDGEEAADGSDTKVANRRGFKLFNLYGDTPFDTINFFKALGYSYEQIKEEGVDTDDLEGEELEVYFGTRVKQIKNASGKYVNDPDGEKENNLTGFRAIGAGEVAKQAKTAAKSSKAGTAKAGGFSL